MSRNASRPSGGGEPVRLQVFLSRSGVSSRRAAEELIAEGRVRVNGATVTAPGSKVRPGLDKVEVDGRLVGLSEIVWLALHKPKGYVTSRQDAFGRKTVYDLLPERYHSLFHVGRLDRDSEGLLLMTNDGGGANRMLHPRYGVTKEYLVDVMGSPSADALRQLTDGVKLDDGTTATAEEVRRLHQVDVGIFRVRIVLREGKKREVRRMMDAVGHPVRRLSRRRFGPIALGELRSGTFRVLGPQELAVVLDPDRQLEARPDDGISPPRRRAEAAEGSVSRSRPARRDDDEAPRRTTGGPRKTVARPAPRRSDDDERPRRSAAGPRKAPSRPGAPRRTDEDETPRRSAAGPRKTAGRPAAPRRSDDEAPRRTAGGSARTSSPRPGAPRRGTDDEAPRRTPAGPRKGPTRTDRPRRDEDDAPRRTARPSAERPRRDEGDDAPRRPASRGPAAGGRGRAVGRTRGADEGGRSGGTRPPRDDARPSRGGDGEDAPRRTSARPSAGGEGPRKSAGRGPAKGGRPAAERGDRPTRGPAKGGRPGPKPGGRPGGSGPGKPPRRGR